MEIVRYTKDRIQDVIDFELNLRNEEDFWGWEIDGKYRRDVEKSFEDGRFQNSISLLAYENGMVVGRIDSGLICSHFDGSVKAYLDWICVLKSARHRGVAQGLMEKLREQLRMEYNVDTLIGLAASNEEAQRFYRSFRKGKAPGCRGMDRLLRASFRRSMRGGTNEDKNQREEL